jgi:predicted transcriptional regulator
MRTAALDTSINAFHAHVGSGRASAQRERIVGFIRQRGGDWSIGELARQLGLEKSTVSARLNESLHCHELSERPKRRDRVSGITVRPVALPVLEQVELFA